MTTILLMHYNIHLSQIIVTCSPQAFFIEPLSKDWSLKIEQKVHNRDFKEYTLSSTLKHKTNSKCASV